MPTPRACCEIVIRESGQKKVTDKDGRDLTKEFIDGAEKALAIVKTIDIKKAILKSKSPSCGCGMIYDGTFSGKLVRGNGWTAELLMKNGIYSALTAPNFHKKQAARLLPADSQL